MRYRLPGANKPYNVSASVLSRKFAYEISLVFSPGSSSFFGHDATASLPHHSSIRTKILRDLPLRNFRLSTLAQQRETRDDAASHKGGRVLHLAIRADQRGLELSAISGTRKVDASRLSAFSRSHRARAAKRLSCLYRGRPNVQRQSGTLKVEKEMVSELSRSHRARTAN